MAVEIYGSLQFMSYEKKELVGAKHFNFMAGESAYNTGFPGYFWTVWLEAFIMKFQSCTDTYAASVCL